MRFQVALTCRWRSNTNSITVSEDGAASAVSPERLGACAVRGIEPRTACACVTLRPATATQRPGSWGQPWTRELPGRNRYPHQNPHQSRRMVRNKNGEFRNSEFARRRAWRGFRQARQYVAPRGLVGACGSSPFELQRIPTSHDDGVGADSLCWLSPTETNLRIHARCRAGAHAVHVVVLCA